MCVRDSLSGQKSLFTDSFTEPVYCRSATSSYASAVVAIYNINRNRQKSGQTYHLVVLAKTLRENKKCKVFFLKVSSLQARKW